jgi:hypothetical protein
VIIKEVFIMDMASLSFTDVDSKITEDCKDLTTAQVESKLIGAKDFKARASVEASLTGYAIGKEISAGQLEKLKAAHNEIMMKYPPQEVIKVTRVYNEETKQVEDKTTTRYVNSKPVGKTGEVSALVGLSETDILREHAKLTPEQHKLLTETEEKGSWRDVQAVHKQLIAELRLPDRLFVLRQFAQDAVESAAITKYEKSQAQLRFAQFKESAYKAELNKRATEAKRAKVVDFGSTWLNPTGIETIQKEIGC